MPVDGLVVEPDAILDEAALTGEPIPVNRQRGERIRSGATNAGQTFTLQSTATENESTYAAIVRLATAAQSAKSPTIRLADRFALMLLPASIGLAGLAWVFSGDVNRALAVMVAATPCPLILAAPVAYVAGVARAARRGILMKGGFALEKLANMSTAMFDKTGTLTVGGARVIGLEVAHGFEPQDMLRLAASLEQASQHVTAQAIVTAALDRQVALETPSATREAMGSGLEGKVSGRRVRVGAHDYVFGVAQTPWARQILRNASIRSALAAFVAVDGAPAGAILLADRLRREAPRAIQGLRALNIPRIVMVTGDRAETAETIVAALDLDAVLSERDPADKVAAVRVERDLNPTLMVGDGINDAPALAAAHVGVAMGARGASASSEAADVVILVDQVDRVAEAVAIARRTHRIAFESMSTGMAMSAAAMLAAAFGWLTPIAAALTQEAIDVAVILNALRALAPARGWRRRSMAQSDIQALRDDHAKIEKSLDRLRDIASALDTVPQSEGVALIREANDIVANEVMTHEMLDETLVYPRLRKSLASGYGLAAMSRMHRELRHFAHVLAKLTESLSEHEGDATTLRDGQRTIVIDRIDLAHPQRAGGRHLRARSRALGFERQDDSESNLTWAAEA